MKKSLALILLVCLTVTCFVGCGGNKKKSGFEGKVVDHPVNEMGNEVEDSSDLPDYPGKKMELQAWYGSGTGALNRNDKATKDVVTPEIYRVTGVKFSEDSFDNGGELMDAKIAKILASKDLPDILIHPERAVLDQMIENDLIYDLTDLLPKYCPNITKMLELNKEQPYFKTERPDGRIYEIQVSPSEEYQNPNIDPQLLARVKNPVDPIGYVYVRDDILKKIYPEAKTQKEIEDLYVKNGQFTKEEILDVTFNSKKEFFDFLYKIKDLNIKENGRKVYPFYVADGIDNWSLLSCMGNIYGYNMNKGSCNYFTYWDKESKQVEYMFAQPFFKDVLKDWTKLVQDDVANPDSLIDTRAAFEEKVNTGQYAVLYGQALPDQNVLNASGASYGYRKVYINIPVNSNKFLFSNMPGETARFAIVKSRIAEEDLPQVLRFFDFMVSKAGQRLAYWGPRSAGLFKEENGVRKFVDKELEEASVYDAANGKLLYYNLQGTAFPSYPYCRSLEQPKLVYDFEPRASMANRYFSMGAVEIPKTIVADPANIWTFDGYGVEGVTKFWAARQAFEDSLTKIFISKNNKEFEANYKEMLNTAKRNGLDDKTLKEINEAYKVINKKYMHNLK